MRRTIYVALVGEGTDTWRPCRATRVVDDQYCIEGPEPPEETWEFHPGDIVRVDAHAFADGTSGLVATSLAGSAPSCGVLPQNTWFCPAKELVIDPTACWEYAMAGAGGPTDTASALHAWIVQSPRFRSLAEFHAVCADCPHCPWVMPRDADG